MKPSAQKNTRNQRKSLSVLLGALWLVLSGDVAQAQAERFGQVLVVEDDGRILDPANPFLGQGRRFEFQPRGAGYVVREALAKRQNRTLGKKITFAAGGHPTRVALSRPVQFYGDSYDQIWIHPHGAVAFGGNWPENHAANAAAPESLLAALVAGPPVAAALWNELMPGRLSSDGVYVREANGHLVVSWADVSSARPEGLPNSFFLSISPEGEIVFEYERLATTWGITGLSPGSFRQATRVADLQQGIAIAPNEAVLGWHRDRPQLNPLALSHRVHAEVPDRFEFLTIFTNQPVEGPHPVYSSTVANEVAGLGKPTFDHGAVFGSESLEHFVMMNDLKFWATDPSASPRHSSYAYAPSTMAVLAHEVGHRWIPRLLGEPFTTTPGSGHWNPRLATEGSFLGGGAFAEENSGNFRVTAAMQRYGYLDRYLMGLIPIEEVPPFYVIDGDKSADHPFAIGSPVSGKRRDLVAQDLVRELGPRFPTASQAAADFRMAFVLIVPAKAKPSAQEIAQVQRLRRAFGPFFRRATGGKARMMTGLGKRKEEQNHAKTSEVSRGRPRILKASIFSQDSVDAVLELEWMDFDGDVAVLEISTDADGQSSPAQMDLVPIAYGHRRGHLQFSLSGLPVSAQYLEIRIVDAAGQGSRIHHLGLSA